MSDSFDLNAKFVRLDSPSIGFAGIREALQDQTVFIIWSLDQAASMKVRFVNISQTSSFLEVNPVIPLDASGFVERLRASDGYQCIFQFGIKDATLFFETGFLGLSAQGDLRFSTPESFHKILRRKKERLKLGQGEYQSVEFEDPGHPGTRMRKPLYDIGDRGIAFLIQEKEGAYFRTGTILHHITFTLGTRKFTFDGVIKNAVNRPKSTQKPGIKIGVEFTNMPEEDQLAINNLLFIEFQRQARGPRN